MRRITHWAIGAHPDDVEIMAAHAILSCYRRTDRLFGAVTVTDGRGGKRLGPYSHLSAKAMAELRQQEQLRAAALGEYGVNIQLGYRSEEVRSRGANVVADLREILGSSRSLAVYTHSLADAKGTHVAVACAVLRALCALPLDRRPGRLLGCEIWGSLDWLDPESKVRLDVSRRRRLTRALVRMFVSQNQGCRRYDAATEARWTANATFGDPDQVDASSHTALAMDMTPLLREGEDPISFVPRLVCRFNRRLLDRLRQYVGR